MTGPGRRAFLGSVWRTAKVAALGGTAFVGVDRLRARLVRGAVAPAGQSPTRPPGALPEDRFRESCTRCFLCAEVCPPRCIQFPSRVEGAQPALPNAPGVAHREAMQPPQWRGDDTPYVLAWEAACILCMRCTEVCPTGALSPIDPDDRDAVKEHTKMGVARIDRKICLPWNRRSWCGACYTVCPYREEAITLGEGNRPTIHPDHCVGCGLCVEVCPIKYKAIAVEPPFNPDVGEFRTE